MISILVTSVYSACWVTFEHHISKQGSNLSEHFSFYDVQILWHNLFWDWWNLGNVNFHFFLGAVWLPDRLEQPEGIQMCFLVCLSWTFLNVTAFLKFLVTLLVWLKGWESRLLSQSSHNFCLKWNIAATIRWDISLAFSLSRRWLPVTLFTPCFSSVLP